MTVHKFPTLIRMAVLAGTISLGSLLVTAQTDTTTETTSTPTTTVERDDGFDLGWLGLLGLLGLAGLRRPNRVVQRDDTVRATR